MPSLALTGTIGSGKTSALELIVSGLQASGIPVIHFSADEENRRLLAMDPDVKDRIISLLGPTAFTPDGQPDREIISRAIVTEPKTKEKLEEILHPRLEQIWKPLAQQHHFPSDAFFVAEIPLLYEKGLDRFFDKVLVVACSHSKRKDRLMKVRSITPEKSEEWTALQLPQDEKISQANHLFWNDGSSDALKHQVQTFLQTFIKP
jgi:dephospho-CoA kinase